MNGAFELSRIRIFLIIALLTPILAVMALLALVAPEDRVALLESRIKAATGDSLLALEFVGSSEVALLPSPKLDSQLLIVEVPPTTEGAARRLTFSDLRVSSSWSDLLSDTGFRLAARQLTFEPLDTEPEMQPLRRNTLDTVLDSLELSNLSFDHSIADGISVIPNLKASLLGGQLSSSVKINPGANPRTILSSGQLNKAEADQALTLLGTKVVPSGYIDLDWSVSLERPHDSSAPPQVFGEASFRGTDIGLSQINLELELCNAFNRATGRQPAVSNAIGTPINSLKANQNIDGYRTDVTDLQLALPGLDIRGSGTIDRLSQTFEARLVTRIGDQFGATVENCGVDRRLASIEWPITCKGSLNDDPKTWCAVELESLLRRGLESELKRRLNDGGVESLLRSLIPGRTE